MLSLLLALAGPAHADGPKPPIDVLRSSVTCELAYVDKYLRAALPLLNAEEEVNVVDALAAHGNAWEHHKSATDLLAVGEMNLAYQRARDARKELKAMVKPLWEMREEAALAALVTEQITCARTRLTITQPYLQSHALDGPKRAWSQADERLQSASLGVRQEQVRLSFFKAEDALHQLDVGIGWQWPETKAAP